MLSEAAIDALTIAYGETISLFPDAYGERGNHPRTIRSLVLLQESRKRFFLFSVSLSKS